MDQSTKLPWWDWIVIPLVVLLIILTLPISVEHIARKHFVWSSTQSNCVARDPLTRIRPIPNGLCKVRYPEYAEVEYRLNRCGFRAGEDCGPKPAGVYRIVIIGSSYSFGWNVRREESFAGLLPGRLSAITGRKVDVYNESMGWNFPPRSVAIRFPEALSAQPDAILWILTPLDIERSAPDIERDAAPPLRGQSVERIRTAISSRSLSMVFRETANSLHDYLSTTTTAIVIQHYLFESSSEYLEHYEANKEHSGFLKAKTDAYWQYHLNQFEVFATDIEQQAHARGVPLIVMLMPDRAQAILLSRGEWPIGDNPYTLGDRVRSIIVRHSGTYVDILPAFRSVPNIEQYYAPVDDHPYPSGHALMSNIIASALTGGTAPVIQPNQSLALSQQGGK